VHANTGMHAQTQCVRQLIDAPLNPRKALRDYVGLILQGHPLRSSLNAEGHIELMVHWSRDHVIVQNDSLFQLAHGKPLDWVCHCSLVGLGVLRVGSVGCIGSGVVSLP